MPYAAARQCLTPGCPRLAIKGGRCAECTQSKNKARREREGSNEERGYGWRWQQWRRMILAEEPLCRICTAGGLTVLATDVDHILPKSKGGTDDRSNLQPLCHECHSRKTMNEIHGKQAP